MAFCLTLLPFNVAVADQTALDTCLVRFDAPVTESIREAIGRVGATVLAYLPPRTLVLRVDPRLRSDLRALPGVLELEDLAAHHKLSPDLTAILERQDCSPHPTRLDAMLFPVDDPRALADSIARRFPDARIDWIRDRPPKRLTLSVPAATLDALVSALATDEAVQYLMPRPELVPLNDQSVWVGQSYDSVGGPIEAASTDPKPYPTTAPLWSRGLIGTGQIVAVADTGLERELCQFEDPVHPLLPQSVVPPAPLTLDLDQRKLLALNAPHASALTTDDAFRHGTHTAGSAVGDDWEHQAGGLDPAHDHGDGMAPGARLIFEDVSGVVTSNCSTNIAIDSIYDLFEQEYAAGARISSNSFGSADGFAFDSATIESDALVWSHEDFAVFVAAGNRGAAGVAGLALCKNCISVGASENHDSDFVDVFGFLDPENMAALSSRGPTPDGRIKPDVVMPGFRVASARLPVDYLPPGSAECVPGSPGICIPSFGGCYRTDLSATCSTGLLLGTSMATPLAAGLGALVREYFTAGFHPTGQAQPSDSRIPSAALLKAVLINGARNMTGRLYERRGTPVDLGPLQDAPSFVQGWGRVMLDDALYFAGDARRGFVADLPHADGLRTGQAVSYPILVVSSDEPLKLTLVWADAPGEPLAAGALINDLDLILDAPGGAVYRGNRWIDDPQVQGDKRSQENPAGKDDVNNVEGILLQAPSPGLYQVTIEAADVPMGPQGFALVVAGALAASSAPPPVPDGTIGVPLRANRIDPAGATIEILWDVTTCPAPGYHLLHGALDDVATPIVAGAVCDPGTTGRYVWSGVPANDAWFLVVPDDAGAVEGLWGLRSDGSPIGGGVASGLCGFEVRDDSGACGDKRKKRGQIYLPK